MEVDARIPDLVIDTQQAIRDGQAKVALDPLAVTAALNEIDRLSARVVKMTTTAAAHVEERDQLRGELESAESIAWDYEAGQVIQLEEIDNLKAEIVDIREQLAAERDEVELKDLALKGGHDLFVELKAELAEVREELINIAEMVKPYGTSDSTPSGDVEWMIAHYVEKPSKAERERIVDITHRLESEHGYLGGSFKMVRAAIDTP